MRLSVVLPVLNEAAGIVDALLPLQPVRDRVEIIVVDGGSRDNTCELARPLADHVLVSEPGRARQMNVGAAVASGEVLVFLHADTQLPLGFEELIRQALGSAHAANAGILVDLESEVQWGRFDVRLSPSSPTLSLVSWMMNQRSRLTGICTGDQAIFVRRDLFARLGGYADIPLMEDIELSRRLRKIARPACLRPALTTSSRKWQKHGVWRTIGLMWWIRLQYWAGVSPAQLVRQYYGDKSKPAQLPQTTRPLLIFAKAPIPGTVKTRLISALGADGACCLYQQLLLHTLHQTQDWPGPRYLYCAPDTTHPLFARLASEHHLQLRQQHGDDLGSRMAHALAEHAEGALLIGTDCPQISTAVLREADQALQTHDTAIIPSEDGGYVMIGQRQPDPAAFAGMSWSHSQVMADTRRRLEAAGKSLWEGATLWDLDEPEDMPRLAAISLPPL